MRNHNLMLILLCLLLGTNSCQLVPQSLADAISGASKKMQTNGNSLFHQTDEVSLQVGSLTVEGEVVRPGLIDLDQFYKREVVIKEALMEQGQIDFIGAYRYKGYSLFDLLHPFNQQKKNADSFRPAIDLYIVIENALGESVTFSWSEIFHTNNPHQILIATEAAPIIPYKKEVDYAMGENWKVVAANDLFAYRVLDNPVKITVRSFDQKEYVINRDLKSLFSPTVRVEWEDGQNWLIDPTGCQQPEVRYYSSFYGMGMGYHAASYFEGPTLAALMEEHKDIWDPQWIRGGLVCFAGLDGYRAIYSYSELFNRVDQVAPILSKVAGVEEGGYYRVFHPAEFYADRSVKALAEIYFFKPE